MSNNIYKILDQVKQSFDPSILVPSAEESSRFYLDIPYEIPHKSELINGLPFIFLGEKNGNYGNPTNYSHNEDSRSKISKNNARYWKGKTGDHHPATGSERPDSVELARNMGLANKGKPSWNKGKTGLPKQSTESNAKRSAAMKGREKPKVQCPHCNKIGGLPTMKQWHFDNCREK